MLRFTLRHDLEMSPERFWSLYLDDAFNAKLYAHLEFPEWKVVEVKEDDREILRVVRAIPKLEAPAAVAKLLGPSFGYTENGRFDKATKTYSFTMKPSTLEGKLRNEGVVRAEPRGEGTCTRVVEITAEAKIFGLGGTIEAAIEKSHRSVWDKSAPFFTQWAKDHPAP